jgi:hypothetical protein
MAFKVGILLLDCVRERLAPLKHLDSQDKVAEAINALFDVDLVKGKSPCIYNFSSLVHPLTFLHLLACRAPAFGRCEE